MDFPERGNNLLELSCQVFVVVSLVIRVTSVKRYSLPLTELHGGGGEM